MPVRFFKECLQLCWLRPARLPILERLLGFAFAQSALIIVAMFIAIAAGMAFPYMLLCAQPAWLRFLPKPGPWMVRVKQFMGFLLLGTLVFLLYVIGAQRGLDGLIWTSCFLLVVSIACWMQGAFIVPTATVREKSVRGGPDVGLVASEAVSILSATSFASARAASSTAQMEGDWKPFSAERLQSELDQGHPVFVDFTAAWCLNCKFNEGHVLENDAVRQAFQRHGVTKLKADWTNGDPVDHKIFATIWPGRCPILCIVSGQIGTTGYVSGIADEKYGHGETRNHLTNCCIRITNENKMLLIAHCHLIAGALLRRMFPRSEVPPPTFPSGFERKNAFDGRLQR